jgi:aspartyl-tRNA(Asn)/glutamyl-tRNA(Gln) amidotransferase subunit C
MVNKKKINYNADMKKKIITKEEVLHLAQLAKLKLTNEEIVKFQTQLSEILTYISQLDEIDTSLIKQTDQVTGLQNITSADGVLNERKLTQDEALRNAPNKKDGYVKVPAIFSE